MKLIGVSVFSDRGLSIGTDLLIGGVDEPHVLLSLLHDISVGRDGISLVHGVLQTFEPRQGLSIGSPLRLPLVFRLRVRSPLLQHLCHFLFWYWWKVASSCPEPFEPQLTLPHNPWVRFMRQRRPYNEIFHTRFDAFSFHKFEFLDTVLV